MPKLFTTVQDYANKPQGEPAKSDHGTTNNALKLSEIPEIAKHDSTAGTPGTSGLTENLKPATLQSILRPSPVKDTDFIENTPEKKKIFVKKSSFSKIKQTSSLKRKFEDNLENETVKKIKEDSAPTSSDKENFDTIDDEADLEEPKSTASTQTTGDDPTVAGSTDTKGKEAKHFVIWFNSFT